MASATGGAFALCHTPETRRDTPDIEGFRPLDRPLPPPILLGVAVVVAMVVAVLFVLPISPLVLPRFSFLARGSNGEEEDDEVFDLLPE